MTRGNSKEQIGNSNGIDGGKSLCVSIIPAAAIYGLHSCWLFVLDFLFDVAVDRHICVCEVTANFPYHRGFVVFQLLFLSDKITNLYLYIGVSFHSDRKVISVFKGIRTQQKRK